MILRFYMNINTTVFQVSLFLMKAPNVTRLCKGSNDNEVKVGFANLNSGFELAAPLIAILPVLKLEALLLIDIDLSGMSITDLGNVEFTGSRTLILKQCYCINFILITLAAAIAKKGSVLFFLQIFLNGS